MQTIPVLMYHDIGPQPYGGFAALSVSVDRFSRQMAYLANNGWTSLNMDCFERIISGEIKPAPKSVLITFDDGYRSFLTNAMPVLKKFGLTASIFIVTDRLGQIADWTGEPPDVNRLTLSVPEIEMLLKSGMDIGGHSARHMNLCILEGAQLEDEIASCMMRLQNAFGLSGGAFAYPFGAHDARVRRVAASYTSLAFTTDEGGVRSGDDRWALRRTMVQPNNPMLDFKLQLRLGLSPIERLRRLKRFGL